MAVFRVLENGKAFLVKSIRPEEEEEFIKLNQRGFIRVETYPQSRYDCYKYNSETTAIEIDQQCELIKHKEAQIAELNRRTKDYIAKTLKSLDWGDTYEEALSELQNSALDTETRILYFLKPKIADITLTQIREKVTFYLAGQYTTEDLQKELEEKDFTQKEIEKFLPLFAEAAEVASLIFWTEEVWKKEEELEEAIQKTGSIDEINQLMSSIQFPPPPGGSEE